MTKLLFILLLSFCLPNDDLFQNSVFTDDKGFVGIFFNSNYSDSYYTLKNPNTHFMGGGGFFDSKLGFYFAFSTNCCISNASNWYDWSQTMVESTFGDALKEKTWDYTKITLGGMTPITKDMTAFLGLSIGEKKYYYRYYDSYEILGDDGRYWIDADEKKLYLAPQFGLIQKLFKYQKYDVNFSLGYETMPNSLIFGLLVSFHNEYVQ